MKEILKNIYGLDKTQGYDVCELAAFEQRFGHIPAVLKDFYGLCGKCGELTFVQDEWIMPQSYEKYGWLAESDDLVIMNENQGVWQARILREDLNMDDPPVYLKYDNCDKLAALLEGIGEEV